MQGKLKLETSIPIPYKGIIFEIERAASGLVTHISATVNVPEQKDWPSLEPSTEPGAKWNLNITSPMLQFVQIQLRTVEGLLSLYGLSSIDIEYPEQTWHADNEEEKKKLGVFSFQQSQEDLKVEQLPFTPIDLVIKSIVMGMDANDIDIPLSFYRKGRIDSGERRYIEAFYDFYFMLETLYGGGKTKNSAIANEMKNSVELVSIIKKLFSDKVFLSHLNQLPSLKEQFNEKYAGKTPEEVIDYFVGIRGFLHHHNPKHPNKWHPENHARFEIDVFVMEHIALEVAFKLSGKYIFSDQANREYSKIIGIDRRRFKYLWF